MKRFILIAGLLPLNAWAGDVDPQIFIGAKGGYQWAVDETYNHSAPHGAMWGIFGGLQFSPAWSWDVGYQYHDTLKAVRTSVDVDTWFIESALRYDWYVQDALSLYGRLGAAYWDVKKREPSYDELNANGFSPLGEVGVNYHISPNLRLSAGYQFIGSIGRSNTGQYDSHGGLISFAYTFGRATPPVLVDTVSSVEGSSEPVNERGLLNQPFKHLRLGRTVRVSFWGWILLNLTIARLSC